MQIITASQIFDRFTVGSFIAPLEAAMRDVSAGRATHPPRHAVPVGGGRGRMGVMYGALGDPAIHGAKILSLFPGAPAMGLSSHQGMVMLFESEFGRPLAALDADALTALRTAAASMMATRALARPDPRVFAICGAGEQAEWHLRGVLESFAPEEVRLWARRPDAAEALARRMPESDVRVRAVATLEEALQGAEVVTTATVAREAFLPGALLEPGQHVNLVGASLADAREIDDAGVARLTMFTDSAESASREAGEILEARAAGAIPPDYPVTEIGAVLAGDAPGRRDADQITGYKSHGLIVQDLAAGWHVVQALTGAGTAAV
ncbi:ornithine cyclodeaminase family protein [Aquicoccus sp. SCR17]|nr:ornithine cyclodeaminase family protein [Carideicomes alvinocaridis]